MTLFAYVGCYTTPERNGQGKGINVYRVDPRSGTFKHVQLLGGLENPSFLAVDKTGHFLYSVHGDRSDVTAYAIDGKTGHLRVIGRQPTGGYNPIHLALDGTGKFLFVTNYGTNSIAVFPVKDDGTLGPYPTLTTLEGDVGPHRTEQKNIRAAPQSNRPARPLLLRTQQGCRQRHDLSDRSQALHRGPRQRVAARPGAAPRHIDFHPTKALAYVINELEFDDHDLSPGPQERPAHADPGAFRPRRRISPATAPARRSGSIAPAATSTSPTAVMTASACLDRCAKGTLTPRQWVPAKGGVPRLFCLDPRQRFLYVANQGGHTILGYKVERDGKLSPTGIRVKVPSPACIVFSGAY